jgi:hypothetical protein
VHGLVKKLQVDRLRAYGYRKYAGDQTPPDRETYAAVEEQAQAARRGLWQDKGARAALRVATAAASVSRGRILRIPAKMTGVSG